MSTDLYSVKMRASRKENGSEMHISGAEKIVESDRLQSICAQLLERAMRQSFIPVVDDRGAFVGIVTRQTIIRRLTTPRLEDSLGTEARPPAAAAAER